MTLDSLLPRSIGPQFRRRPSRRPRPRVPSGQFGEPEPAREGQGEPAHRGPIEARLTVSERDGWRPGGRTPKRHHGCGGAAGGRSVGPRWCTGIGQGQSAIPEARVVAPVLVEAGDKRFAASRASEPLTRTLPSASAFTSLIAPSRTLPSGLVRWRMPPVPKGGRVCRRVEADEQGLRAGRAVRSDVPLDGTHRPLLGPAPKHRAAVPGTALAQLRGLPSVQLERPPGPSTAGARIRRCRSSGR